MKTITTIKRILVFILCVSMIAGMFSINVAAAGRDWLVCDKEVHSHTEGDCYTVSQHTHDASCYDTTTEHVDACYEAHVHSDECAQQEHICSEAACVVHSHGDECYQHCGDDCYVADKCDGLNLLHWFHYSACYSKICTHEDGALICDKQFDCDKTIDYLCNDLPLGELKADCYLNHGLTCAESTEPVKNWTCTKEEHEHSKKQGCYVEQKYALHLDIHIGLTATYTLDGREYNENVELTVDDFNKGRLVITGGSGLSTNGAYDPGQLRFHGTLPVGTSTKPVYYNIKLTKDVTFNTHNGPVTLPMTFARTVNFWHPDNICETLRQSSSKVSAWSKGEYVEIGMDFKLGASAASGTTEPEKKTLTIQKNITGIDLTEAETVTFGVYDSTGTKVDTVTATVPADGVQTAVGTTALPVDATATYYVVEEGNYNISGYTLSTTSSVDGKTGGATSPSFVMDGNTSVVFTNAYSNIPTYDISYTVSGDAPATYSAIPAGETGVYENTSKRVAAGLSTTETTKDGIPGTWNFIGWTTADVAVDNGAYKMPANDVEFVGTWSFTPETGYSISYKVVGETPATYSSVPAAESGVYAGTAKTVAADLTTDETTKDGIPGTWTFNTWTTNDASVSDGAYKMPANNVEFTGSWSFEADPAYSISYTVTGDAPDAAKTDATPAGESGIYAGTVKTVEAGLTTTDNMKDGAKGQWVFSGWSTDDALISEGKITMPKGNVAFVGSWTFAAENTYSVSYEVTGAAPATSSAIPATVSGIYAGAGMDVAAGLSTTETTKDGARGVWTFNGWTTADAEVANGAYTMPANNVKFTGTWSFAAEDTYSISYKVEGETPATSSAIPAGEAKAYAGDAKTVEAGLSTTETTKNGVAGTGTFSGWTTADAEVANGEYTMPAKNVEFVGSWSFEASPTPPTPPTPPVVTPVTSDISYTVVGETPFTSSEMPKDETGIAAGTDKTVADGLTTTEIMKDGVVGTWTFSGWTTTDATVADGAFKMPARDVAFVGSWTFVAAEEPPADPPIDIPDDDVPLAPEPGTDPVDPPLVDIEDEEVPLADIPDEDVPRTGDPSVIYAALCGASGLGLLGLNLFGKRKDEEEEAE